MQYCDAVKNRINKVGHYKHFAFKCAEAMYHIEEKFTCRKLVIGTEQEDNNNEKGIFYSSILSGDPSLSYQIIVKLMTSRWRYQ